MHPAVDEFVLRLKHCRSESLILDGPHDLIVRAPPTESVQQVEAWLDSESSSVCWSAAGGRQTDGAVPFVRTELILARQHLPAQPT